ncbi:sensor histidine kinase [Schlesneria paludicola]|uniref:sensor histidine kinase n=1 Tax=Schlesneria paludicola TaxID=360056 RepID=UPI00029AC2C7|nr:HAMP domain-containing sensor histidine kinase [Schlesneria paludicola]
MSSALRSRTTIGLPITLSVVLMTLNVMLMVYWIVLLAHSHGWSSLIIGVAVFALILVGLSFYLFLMIKEVRLNQRQANFIDSVTHELKSPIASLRLYLETLEMRAVTDEQRTKFYRVMEEELERLDHLITQLLEVGRIDAIGEQSVPEEIDLDSFLRKCGAATCAHHKCEESETITYDFQPAMVFARPLVLETVFRNLLDNAIKYAGEPPRVEVQVRLGERGRVITRIMDNGQGVPPELRKRIFRMFFRAGSELTRRRKGTGLGLYIVHTLVKQLNGRVSVHDRSGQPGSVFEVDLPGHRGLATTPNRATDALN